VIGSGVDVPPYVREEARPPEVLFAGRLSTEKGILDLLAAVDGDMRLVIAGDGPLRDQVPGALGFVPHDKLGPLYDRAAVVAVPSHREGFGVVCAEAMAHGRAVVAAAVGGLLDLVLPEETGLLVPPQDVPALRQALRRLLDDRDLRAQLGLNARRHVLEHFSWESVTDRTLDAYAEALA
jgi:glycosyltransferase involved in cell wall biosynthesis